MDRFGGMRRAGAGAASLDLSVLAGDGLAPNPGGTGIDNELFTGVDRALTTIVGGTAIGQRLRIRHGLGGGLGARLELDPPVLISSSHTAEGIAQLQVESVDTSGNGHATLHLNVNRPGHDRHGGMTVDDNGDVVFFSDGQVYRWYMDGVGVDLVTTFDKRASPQVFRFHSAGGGTAGVNIDRTNGRLGVGSGTTSPIAPLHIAGSGVVGQIEGTTLTWIMRSTGATGFARLQLEGQSGSANTCGIGAYGTTASGSLFGFNVADRVVYEHLSCDVIFGLSGGASPQTRFIAFATNDLGRFSIEGNGDVVMGLAALATTATGGFFFAPSCAGPPTGVPTTRTGRVPIIVDTSTGTGALYVNIGGTWRSVALA